MARLIRRDRLTMILYEAIGSLGKGLLRGLRTALSGTVNIRFATK
jgi:hypothetical protein